MEISKRLLGLLLEILLRLLIGTAESWLLGLLEATSESCYWLLGLLWLLEVTELLLLLLGLCLLLVTKWIELLLLLRLLEISKLLLLVLLRLSLWHTVARTRNELLLLRGLRGGERLLLGFGRSHLDVVQG